MQMEKISELTTSLSKVIGSGAMGEIQRGMEEARCAVRKVVDGVDMDIVTERVK